ncbi:hypothetical protein ACLOJK_029008 [Asimina triloba]
MWLCTTIVWIEETSKASKQWAFMICSPILGDGPTLFTAGFSTRLHFLNVSLHAPNQTDALEQKNYSWHRGPEEEPIHGRSFGLFSYAKIRGRDFSSVKANFHLLFSDTDKCVWVGSRTERGSYFDLRDSLLIPGHYASLSVAPLAVLNVACHIGPPSSGGTTPWFLADCLLGLAVLRRYSPLMTFPSAGNVGTGDDLVRSYASAVSKPSDTPSFKIPLQFPMDINDELDFIFTETEIMKAAEDYKFAIVMKFLRTRPSIDVIRLNVVKKWSLEEISMIRTDNATLNRSRATCAGICVEIDLTIELVKGFPIVVSSTKRIWQEARYENKATIDCRDEDCEEVCCDKENEVASETLQLKGKEFPYVPKNLVDEMKNILVENQLQGNLAMGYSSDPEEGELIRSMGKEKAYDSEEVDRSVADK